MKKIMRALSLAVICGALLLSGCSGAAKVVYQDGMFVDKTHHVNYLDASISYEPVSLGEEYAQCGSGKLYMITGTDPKEWLTDTYGVYYAEGVKLPTLPKMQPDNVQICIVSSISVGIGEITDADTIAALVDALENGERVSVPVGETSYQLKFRSAAVPYLQYCVTYVKCSDGSRYLYDRGEKYAVEIGRLIEKYLPDDNDSAESIVSGLESSLPEGQPE